MQDHEAGESALIRALFDRRNADEMRRLTQDNIILSAPNGVSTVGR